MEKLFALTLLVPSFASTAAVSAATCTLNGENVPCEELGNLFYVLTVGFPIGILLVLGLLVVSNWFIYQKANVPGWASLVPVYNLVKLLEIIGKPTWWVLLMFIPFVNLVLYFIINFKLARVFGKGTGFGFGMVFLPFIFYPILAFGSAQYTGTVTVPQPGLQ